MTRGYRPITQNIRCFKRYLACEMFQPLHRGFGALANRAHLQEGRGELLQRAVVKLSLGQRLSGGVVDLARLQSLSWLFIPAYCLHHCFKLRYRHLGW